MIFIDFQYNLLVYFLLHRHDSDMKNFCLFFRLSNLFGHCTSTMSSDYDEIIRAYIGILSRLSSDRVIGGVGTQTGKLRTFRDQGPQDNGDPKEGLWGSLC